MKILAFFVCICLMLSLVACGNQAPEVTEPQGTEGITQVVVPENTDDQQPDENQCAADATIEETDYPTDPEETQAEEEVQMPEETLGENPGVETEEGDIVIPLD